MKNPVLFIVMDGVGIGDGGEGDAVARANMPFYKGMLKEYPHTQLKAHGTAVGLPGDGDMGNSEVGHNALGCGQIYAQGAKLVAESLRSGEAFRSPAWKEMVDHCKDQGAMHFLGLLSDGNVHSHIDHLFILLRQAKKEGIHRVYCHILLDGRDVPATSALTYIDSLEKLLTELSDGNFKAQIASGGGRMNITMDRYEADWDMVRRGFDCHVHGVGRQFSSAAEAVKTYRDELGCIDQDLPAFVIAKDGIPVGPVHAGDSVILFNFRGDRALEISRALGDKDFSQFDRGDYHDVMYAGILEYDGDLHIPARYLVQPPEIRHTLTEQLIEYGIREYAISETQKFGHVTYFWNGNRSEKFSEELETWKEIPSDLCPFNEKPAMKCREITDCLLEAMESGQYGFLRCNFPNGDMVGHTGDIPAVIQSLEAMDVQLGRLQEAARRLHITMIVTADHGNSDQMIESDGHGGQRIRTAHSLNPVNFIITRKDVRFGEGPYGLANCAATVADLLGVPVHPDWEPSMLAEKPE